jgi:prenylcysteine oxidase/farnesylcysteine lyase
MKSLAVVGAGIGGCSAAYFASKHIPNTKLTIYDAQARVGGRILTHKTDGLNLEIGASFINGSNKTILGIISNEHLNLSGVQDQADFAVWNGSEILFKSNKNAAITDFKLLSAYRLSIIRALSLLREAKGQVAKLYGEEMKNPADLAELFELAGLGRWHKKTFDEILSESGVSRTFIDEIAAPITRTIYSQNADLGGFAGISSLIGVYGGPIYRLTDGNNTLPARLAEASHAAVKPNQKVTSIEKTSEGNYRVSTDTENALFDGVIIAAPFDLSGIELDGIIKPVGSPQEYQKLYTKVMKGALNPRYFGLTDSELPKIILTTKEADPMTHFSIQKASKGEFLLTICSTEQLTGEAFSGIFTSGGITVLNHCWDAAYPKFKPTPKLPSSLLDERVVYLNSIEAAVSSMETSAFSAVNAIKILKKSFS